MSILMEPRYIPPPHTIPAFIPDLLAAPACTTFSQRDDFFSFILATQGFQELMDRQHYRYEGCCDGMERLGNLLLEFEHMYFDHEIEHSTPFAPRQTGSYVADLPRCAATAADTAQVFESLDDGLFVLPPSLAPGWDSPADALSSDIAVLERVKKHLEEHLEKTGEQQLGDGFDKASLKAVRRRSLERPARPASRRSGNKPKGWGARAYSAVFAARDRRPAATPFRKKRQRTCTSQRKKRPDPLLTGPVEDHVAGKLSFASVSSQEIESGATLSPREAVEAVLQDGVRSRMLTDELAGLLRGILADNAVHLDLRSSLSSRCVGSDDAEPGHFCTSRVHRALLEGHGMELWVGARSDIGHAAADEDYSKCPSCDKILSIGCIQSGFCSKQCTDDSEKDTLSRCSSLQASLEKVAWTSRYHVEMKESEGSVCYEVLELPGKQLHAIDGRFIKPGMTLEQVINSKTSAQRQVAPHAAGANPFPLLPPPPPTHRSSRKG